MNRPFAVPSRRTFLQICTTGIALVAAPKPRRRRRERAHRASFFPTPWGEPELLSEGPPDPDR